MSIEMILVTDKTGCQHDLDGRVGVYVEKRTALLCRNCDSYVVRGMDDKGYLNKQDWVAKVVES